MTRKSFLPFAGVHCRGEAAVQMLVGRLELILVEPEQDLRNENQSPDGQLHSRSRPRCSRSPGPRARVPGPLCAKRSPGRRSALEVGLRVLEDPGLGQLVRLVEKDEPVRL